VLQCTSFTSDLTVSFTTVIMAITSFIFIFFFFFQAEDGIRDYKVTGVQTCALPIYAFDRCGGEQCLERHLDVGALLGRKSVRHRSEERRVGKECRSRWSPDH